MRWTDGVTFWIAVLGAVLGVFNFVRSILRERPRLVLRARQSVSGEGLRCIVLEVVNRSAYPITVSMIGFALEGGEIGFHSALGHDLPQRLDPRAAFAASMPLAIADEADWFRRVRGVYAGTACGLRITRPDQWLRTLAKQSAAAPTA